MKAEILAIGAELVHGEKLDTNSQWLSLRLAELGIPTHHFTVVGDDLEEMLSVLRIACGRSDLVIVGGGLGPTQDDLTRDALAALAGTSLQLDPSCLETLEAFFARRNREMPERNRVQAMIPRGAGPLLNEHGTAPGIWIEVGPTALACLPGVPSELRAMFSGQVMPRLHQRGWVRSVIVRKVVNIFGLGESEVEANALDLTARGRDPEVGITASDATITFRLSTSGANEEQALARLEPTLELIRERFGDLIISEAEGEDLEHALFRELQRTRRTLATAESCTGGLIAQRLTSIPGSSEVFLGGVVSYANSAKTSLLGVDPALISAQGAVSPEVARAMASGVRERLGADLGLAVTGVAGPAGGTVEKPVGLVYLGLATQAGIHALELRLGPEQPRSIIQSRAAKHAMNLARRALINRQPQA